MPRRDTRFVLANSPFAAALAERHPGWLGALAEAGRLEQDRPPQAADLAGAIAVDGLEAGLRRFRNREMLRITWRELTRTASLQQTLSDLSGLAELCLEAALVAQHAALAESWGLPLDERGAPQSLVVLALGKLGGGELNLSSDVDLVLCHPSAGECDGPRRRSANEFFTRLARDFIRVLSEVTADGFCFRVDTRLRPFGDSGPLVCSFGAMEQYYQRDGRDWERYALVKARTVAGDLGAGAQLLDRLRPFVYRRYTDFGAVEALREMLDSIHQDAARRGREDDVKRGPGGIREVEFLVQCLQLLRGGREPTLQTPSLLAALDAAQALGLFTADRAGELREAYGFLRRLENAIQALHDRQVHTLPGGEDGARVARVMGCTDLTALHQLLAETRARVSHQMEASFPRPRAGEAAGSTWREGPGALPELAGKPLEDFRARLQRVALSARAAERLDRFMPLLLGRMHTLDMPEPLQDEVFELVWRVCRRSAYLALLVENPAALDRMLELFSASAWVAGNVTRHPALLDELIDPALGRNLARDADLEAGVARLLAQHDDTEAALSALNGFRGSCQLRIAVAELSGQLDTPGAEALLTALAQALLAGCLELARRHIVTQHGSLRPGGLGVIAYGTLGAGAMSYGSDLDLIFLYPPTEAVSDGPRPLAAETWYTRLARRMLNLANTPTPAGRLYEIDTRLRPNGRAGLLVSSLDAFARYQASEAWVWELQALIRARPVAGDAATGAAFEQVRRAALSTERDARHIGGEVRDMRRRMRAELGGGDPFKHAPGAIVDIDFVAQLGTLLMAPRHPALLDHRDSPGLLQALAAVGWLAEAEAETLRAAHRALAHHRHLRALARAPGEGLPDLAASAEVCARFLD